MCGCGPWVTDHGMGIQLPWGFGQQSQLDVSQVRRDRLSHAAAGVGRSAVVDSP